MRFLIGIANAGARLMHQLSCGVVLPALVVLIVADIISRNVLGSALYWAPEVSGLLLLSLFFLELPYMAQQRALLQIGPLRQSSPRTQRWLETLAALALLLFALLLITQAWLGLQDMFHYGDRAFVLPLPLWPFSLLMLISGLLVLMHALLQIGGRSQQAKSS